MVAPVSWFSRIDLAILDFFETHEIAVSPKVLGAAIDYHRSYVGIRLRILRDAGLIDQREDDLYELSDLGMEFLAGNLPVEKVEELDPDRDSSN